MYIKLLMEVKNMFGRQKMAAVTAEFVGTAVLASTILSMAGRTSFPFFASVVAGLTMALMVLVIGPISGAHINPVVTIGLWTTRKLQTTQAIMYVLAQLLGGAAAWQMNEYLLNQPLRNNAGGSLNWRVLIAEAIGAFVFTLALSAAVSRAYTGAKLAVTAGLGLTIGMIMASLASNGIINPAAAVGIQSLNWAYTLGPLLGGIVGMNLYGLLFAPLDVTGLRAVKANVATAVKKTRAKAKKVTRKRK